MQTHQQNEIPQHHQRFTFPNLHLTLHTCWLHTLKAFGCFTGSHLLCSAQPHSTKRPADVSLILRPNQLQSSIHWPASLSSIAPPQPSTLAIDVTTAPSLAKNRVRPDPKTNLFEVHLDEEQRKLSCNQCCKSQPTAFHHPILFC